MKKSLSKMLVLLLSLGCCFSSCSDDNKDEVEIKAKLTVTPASLEFSASGGEEEVAVSTQLASWNVTADPAAPWCVITKEEGKFKVEVEEFSEKTDRTAKIKVTSGDESQEVVVTQKAVTAELSPEKSEVTLNGFGTAVKIKVTASEENWEVRADENSAWLRPSKEGEYLIIQATLTESERTGTILLSLNEVKTTVTVKQSRAETNVGALYLGEDETAIGVIINKDEENHKIYIISTEERQVRFTPFEGDGKIYVQTDSKDGQKALATLKEDENWKEKYPIIAYCEEIEEKTKVNGWYIAATSETEVWDALRDNMTTINTALSASGNQELGSSMTNYQEFWTSTPSFRRGSTYAMSIETKSAATWTTGYKDPRYEYIARCVLRIEYINE